MSDTTATSSNTITAPSMPIPVDEPVLDDDGLGGSLGAFVMATLQRLRNKDRAVRAQVAEMRSRTNQADELQRGLQVLQRIRMSGDHIKGNGVTGVEELVEAGLLPEGSTDADMARYVESLENEYGIELTIHDPKEGVDRIQSNTIDAAIESVNSRLTRLNSSTELDMINLQSTLESRSNEFRVISQIMSGQHETLRSIVGNIG